MREDKLVLNPELSVVVLILKIRITGHPTQQASKYDLTYVCPALHFLSYAACMSMLANIVS